jgi:hypothetical protein
MRHAATITAFANKFGTFTGVVRDESTGAKTIERFHTLDAARNFARAKVWEAFGPGRYASMRRKGESLANYWI